MLKPRTIQSKLFISYSSFILCIIIIFIMSFYFYTAGTLESKSSESLYQLSGYISNQLDAELENMNSLSEKILFSQPLMEIYYSEIYTLASSSIYGQRKFNELVYSITGPQFPVFQINIFQKSGNLAGIGINNSFLSLSVNDIAKISWVNDVLKLNGTKLITIPHNDDFRFSNKQVISLCRSFAQNYGKSPDSIIEIQQDYKQFESIINNALITPDSKKTITQKVYVYNPKGELVYPLIQKSVTINKIVQLFWNEIKKHNNVSHVLRINKSDTDEEQIFAFTHSDFSNWTVVVSELEANMLNPVTKFRNNTLLAGLVILLITLVLSYFVSRGFTTPIKKLHKSIKNLSLQSLPVNAPLHAYSRIIELEDLNQSFTEMCQKLKDSLEEVVSSRSHEMQARMLALQSQMNPHFLYNTITVISIMAEGEGKSNVVKACLDLSNMLRYISSDDTAQVTINQELEHTLNYLNLMKIRYRDDLYYKLDVPENILDIKVPKLVIQPLVENCVKYAISLDPPWKIVIYGKLSPGMWEISIHDNGQGFDEKWLKETIAKLESIDPYNNLPCLKLDGMGLTNIFIRLKIMYGSKAIFKMYNHPNGGSVVNIGGPT